MEKAPRVHASLASYAASSARAVRVHPPSLCTCERMLKFRPDATVVALIDHNEERRVLASTGARQRMPIQKLHMCCIAQPLPDDIKVHADAVDATIGSATMQEAFHCYVGGALGSPQYDAVVQRLAFERALATMISPIIGDRELQLAGCALLFPLTNMFVLCVGTESDLVAFIASSCSPPAAASAASMKEKDVAVHVACVPLASLSSPACMEAALASTVVSRLAGHRGTKAMRIGSHIKMAQKVLAPVESLYAASQAETAGGTRKRALVDTLFCIVIIQCSPDGCLVVDLPGKP